MNIRTVQTPEEKTDAFEVRRIVFIEEQQVPPEDEMDAHDQSATHFVGYDNGAATAVGRVRLLEDCGKLERIAVMRESRGRGFGRQMIQAMEQMIQISEVSQAKLNAQTHAEDFYKSLGYHTVSDIFMDAGIEHVAMVKYLN